MAVYGETARPWSRSGSRRKQPIGARRLWVLGAGRVMNGHGEKGSGFGHCMGRAAALLFYKAKPISGLFFEVPKSNRLSFCETKPTSHLLSAEVTSLFCRLFS